MTEKSYIIQKTIGDSFVWFIVNYLVAVLLAIVYAVTNTTADILFISGAFCTIITVTLTIIYSFYNFTEITDDNPFNKLKIFVSIFIIIIVFALLTCVSKNERAFNIFSSSLKPIIFLVLLNAIWCYFLSYPLILEHVREITAKKEFGDTEKKYGSKGDIWESKINSEEN